MAVHGKARTFVLEIEDGYKIKLNSTSAALPWILRHTGWILTRFQLKSDGHAAFFHRRGREYKGEVLPLMETVVAKDPSHQQAKLDTSWTPML